MRRGRFSGNLSFENRSKASRTVGPVYHARFWLGKTTPSPSRPPQVRQVLAVFRDNRVENCLAVTYQVHLIDHHDNLFNTQHAQ